ncbi:MAG: hypothetical protein J7J92_00195 [Candidatus Aenigmarchaeota archaeon]|nr:hypothetical protein [Candidatus Aenigmarchaeota archaeon]
MSFNPISIGILFILVGIFILIVSSLHTGEAKLAVGGFIGPIPFGWANDPKMLKWIIFLSTAALIIFIIFIGR